MSVLEELRHLCSSSAYTRALLDPSSLDRVLGSVSRAFVCEDKVSTKNEFSDPWFWHHTPRLSQDEGFSQGSVLARGAPQAALKALLQKEAAAANTIEAENKATEVSAISWNLLERAVNVVRRVESDPSLAHMIETFANPIEKCCDHEEVGNTGLSPQNFFDALVKLLERGITAPQHESLSLLLLVSKILMCTIDVETADVDIAGGRLEEESAADSAFAAGKALQKLRSAAVPNPKTLLVRAQHDLAASKKSLHCPCEVPSLNAVRGLNPVVLRDGLVSSVVACGHTGMLAWTDAQNPAEASLSFSLEVTVAGGIQVGWATLDSLKNGSGGSPETNRDMGKGCCLYDGSMVWDGSSEHRALNVQPWIEGDVVSTELDLKNQCCHFKRNGVDVFFFPLPCSSSEDILQWRPVVGLVKDSARRASLGAPVYPAVSESLLGKSKYLPRKKNSAATPWSWGLHSDGLQRNSNTIEMAPKAKTVAPRDDSSSLAMLGAQVLRVGVHRWSLKVSLAPDTSFEGGGMDVCFGVVSDDATAYVNSPDKLQSSCRHFCLWQSGSDESRFITSAGRRKPSKRDSIPVISWNSDTVQITLDCDAGKITFGRNGSMVQTLGEFRPGTKWQPVVILPSQGGSVSIVSQTHLTPVVAPVSGPSSGLVCALAGGLPKLHSLLERFVRLKEDHVGEAMTLKPLPEKSNAKIFSESVGDFSMSLWLRLDAQQPESSSPWLSVLFKGKDSSQSRMPALFLSPSDLRLAVCVSTAEDWNAVMPSLTPLMPLLWIHVAVVCKGCSLSLFVNGTLDASLTLASPPLHNDEPFFFGRCPEGVKTPSADYKGVVGHVGGALFAHRALAEHEVSSLAKWRVTAAVDVTLASRVSLPTRLRLSPPSMIALPYLRALKPSRGFTVEAIFVMRSFANRSVLFSQGSSSTSGFALGVNKAGSPFFQAYKSGVMSCSSSSAASPVEVGVNPAPLVQLGKVYHLAVVYSQAPSASSPPPSAPKAGTVSVRFILDGFDVGGGQFKHGGGVLESQFSTARIGAPVSAGGGSESSTTTTTKKKPRSTGGEQGWDGDLLDLRIWEAPLSVSQIKEFMSRTVAPCAAGSGGGTGPPSHAVPAPRCPSSGHPMFCSDGSEEGGYRTFVCNKCGETAESKRWWCALCRDDFCALCFPRVGRRRPAHWLRFAEGPGASALFDSAAGVPGGASVLGACNTLSGPFEWVTTPLNEQEGEEEGHASLGACAGASSSGSNSGGGVGSAPSWQLRDRISTPAELLVGVLASLAEVSSSFEVAHRLESKGRGLGMVVPLPRCAVHPHFTPLKLMASLLRQLHHGSSSSGSSGRGLDGAVCVGLPRASRLLCLASLVRLLSTNLYALAQGPPLADPSKTGLANGSSLFSLGGSGGAEGDGAPTTPTTAAGAPASSNVSFRAKLLALLLAIAKGAEEEEEGVGVTLQDACETAIATGLSVFFPTANKRRAFVLTLLREQDAAAADVTCTLLDKVCLKICSDSRLALDFAHRARGTTTSGGGGGVGGTAEVAANEEDGEGGAAAEAAAVGVAAVKENDAEEPLRCLELVKALLRVSAKSMAAQRLLFTLQLLWAGAPADHALLSGSGRGSGHVGSGNTRLATTAATATGISQQQQQLTPLLFAMTNAAGVGGSGEAEEGGQVGNGEDNDGLEEVAMSSRFKGKSIKPPTGDGGEGTSSNTVLHGGSSDSWGTCVAAGKSVICEGSGQHKFVFKVTSSGGSGSGSGSKPGDGLLFVGLANASEHDANLFLGSSKHSFGWLLQGETYFRNTRSKRIHSPSALACEKDLSVSVAVRTGPLKKERGGARGGGAGIGLTFRHEGSGEEYQDEELNANFAKMLGRGGSYWPGVSLYHPGQSVQVFAQVDDDDDDDDENENDGEEGGGKKENKKDGALSSSAMVASAPPLLLAAETDLSLFLAYAFEVLRSVTAHTAATDHFRLLPPPLLVKSLAATLCKLAFEPNNALASASKPQRAELLSLVTSALRSVDGVRQRHEAAQAFGEVAQWEEAQALLSLLGGSLAAAGVAAGAKGAEGEAKDLVVVGGDSGAAAAAAEEEEEKRLRAWCSCRLLEAGLRESGGFLPALLPSADNEHGASPLSSLSSSSSVAAFSPFLADLIEGVGGAMEVREHAVTLLGAASFNRFKNQGPEMARALRAVAAAMLLHSGAVQLAREAAEALLLSTQHQLKQQKEEEETAGSTGGGGGAAAASSEELSPRVVFLDPVLLKVFEREKVLRMWCVSERKALFGGGDDGYARLAALLEAKALFLLTFLPRIPDSTAAAASQPPTAVGEERTGSRSQGRSNNTASPPPPPPPPPLSARVAMCDDVAKFVKSRAVHVGKMKALLEAAEAQALECASSLAACNELLRFDSLPCVAVGAVVSNFLFFDRGGGGGGQGGKKREEAREAPGSSSSSSSSSWAQQQRRQRPQQRHLLDGLELSGWRARQHVKLAFDALFMRLGSELRRAVDTSEYSLQLVLLNAWGLTLRQEDHALLLQARLFDSLHAILSEEEEEHTFFESLQPLPPSPADQKQQVPAAAAAAGVSPTTRQLRRAKRAALKLVVLLASQVAEQGEIGGGAASSGVGAGGVPPLMVPIALKRQASGSGTFTDSVFHLVFQELEGALDKMTQSTSSSSCRPRGLCGAAAVGKKGATRRGGGAGGDSLGEVLKLLCSILETDTCRKFLASSAWVGVLLGLLHHSSPRASGAGVGLPPPSPSPPLSSSQLQSALSQSSSVRILDLLLVVLPLCDPTTLSVTLPPLPIAVFHDSTATGSSNINAGGGCGGGAHDRRDSESAATVTKRRASSTPTRHTLPNPPSSPSSPSSWTTFPQTAQDGVCVVGYLLSLVALARTPAVTAARGKGARSSRGASLPLNAAWLGSAVVPLLRRFFTVPQWRPVAAQVLATAMHAAKPPAGDAEKEFGFGADSGGVANEWGRDFVRARAVALAAVCVLGGDLGSRLQAGSLVAKAGSGDSAEITGGGSVARVVSVDESAQSVTVARLGDNNGVVVVVVVEGGGEGSTRTLSLASREVEVVPSLGWAEALQLAFAAPPVTVVAAGEAALTAAPSPPTSPQSAPQSPQSPTTGGAAEAAGDICVSLSECVLNYFCAEMAREHNRRRLHETELPPPPTGYGITLLVLHPWHPQHPLKLSTRYSGWSCDGKKHQPHGCRGNGGGGPGQPRYRCCCGCDYDLCQSCWDAARLMQPSSTHAKAFSAFCKSNSKSNGKSNSKSSSAAWGDGAKATEQLKQTPPTTTLVLPGGGMVEVASALSVEAAKLKVQAASRGKLAWVEELRFVRHGGEWGEVKDACETKDARLAPSSCPPASSSSSSLSSSSLSASPLSSTKVSSPLSPLPSRGVGVGGSGGGKIWALPCSVRAQDASFSLLSHRLAALKAASVMAAVSPLPLLSRLFDSSSSSSSSSKNKSSSSSSSSSGSSGSVCLTLLELASRGTEAGGLNDLKPYEALAQMLSDRLHGLHVERSAPLPPLPSPAPSQPAASSSSKEESGTDTAAASNLSAGPTAPPELEFAGLRPVSRRGQLTSASTSTSSTSSPSLATTTRPPTLCLDFHRAITHSLEMVASLPPSSSSASSQSSETGAGGLPLETEKLLSDLLNHFVNTVLTALWKNRGKGAAAGGATGLTTATGNTTTTTTTATAATRALTHDAVVAAISEVLAGRFGMEDLLGLSLESVSLRSSHGWEDHEQRDTWGKLSEVLQSSLQSFFGVGPAPAAAAAAATTATSTTSGGVDANAGLVILSCAEVVLVEVLELGVDVLVPSASAQFDDEDDEDNDDDSGRDGEGGGSVFEHGPGGVRAALSAVTPSALKEVLEQSDSPVVSLIAELEADNHNAAAAATTSTAAAANANTAVPSTATTTPAAASPAPTSPPPPPPISTPPMPPPAPLPVVGVLETTAAAAAAGDDNSPAALALAAELGFPVKWCSRALAATNGDAESALSWILSQSGDGLTEFGDDKAGSATTAATTTADEAANKAVPPSSTDEEHQGKGKGSAAAAGVVVVVGGDKTEEGEEETKEEGKVEESKEAGGERGGIGSGVDARATLPPSPLPPPPPPPLVEDPNSFTALCGDYRRWWPLPPSLEASAASTSGGGGGGGGVEVSFRVRAYEEVRVCLAPPPVKALADKANKKKKEEAGGFGGGDGGGSSRSDSPTAADSAVGKGLLEVVLWSASNSGAELSFNGRVVARAVHNQRRRGQGQDQQGQGQGVCFDPTDFVGVKVRVLPHRVDVFVGSSFADDSSLVPVLSWCPPPPPPLPLPSSHGTDNGVAEKGAAEGGGDVGADDDDAATPSTCTFASAFPTLSRMSLGNGGGSGRSKRVCFRDISAVAAVLPAERQGQHKKQDGGGGGGAFGVSEPPVQSRSHGSLRRRRESDLLEHVIEEDHSSTSEYHHSSSSSSSSEAVLMARPVFPLLSGAASLDRSSSERRRSSHHGSGGSFWRRPPEQQRPGASAPGGVGGGVWHPVSTRAEFAGLLSSWGEAQVLARFESACWVLEALYARRLVLELLKQGPKGTLTKLLKAAAAAAAVAVVEEEDEEEEREAGAARRLEEDGAANNNGDSYPLHLFEAILVLTTARGRLNNASLLGSLGRVVSEDPQVLDFLAARTASHLAAAALPEFDQHPWDCSAANEGLSDSFMLCMPPVALVEWLTDLELN